MATDPDFIDYYEVLEASPNASTATLERVFRYLAKRHHPDSSEHGDVKTFSRLVEAYETLTDPAARAAYDISYDEQKNQNNALVQETGHLSSDAADRQRLMALFYAQRRRSMKTPGIGAGSLEHMTGLPEEVLNFHLWFFQQKGWIMREEGGQLSISADGVEKVEANTKANDELNRKRITEAKDRVTAAPATFASGVPAAAATV